MDIASIMNNAEIKEMYPTKSVKIVENNTPPYKNTQGTIKGPVPSITFIIIIIVIKGVQFIINNIYNHIYSFNNRKDSKSYFLIFSLMANSYRFETNIF